MIYGFTIDYNYNDNDDDRNNDNSSYNNIYGRRRCGGKVTPHSFETATCPETFSQHLDGKEGKSVCLSVHLSL